MAKGESGIGGNSFSKQAAENVKGVNGYNVVSSDGTKLEFYFKTGDGETYYSNSLGALPEPTPNGWTEKEMMDVIKNNGGQVQKYSKSELVNKEAERLKDREETDRFLTREYARNRGADIGAKIYRNSRKASRIARRRG